MIYGLILKISYNVFEFIILIFCFVLCVSPRGSISLLSRKLYKEVMTTKNKKERKKINNNYNNNLNRKKKKKERGK